MLLERRIQESSAMGLPSRTHEDTSRERIDEYWHLRPARGAKQLTEYQKSLLDMLSYVEGVILEHPTIKGCLGSVGDFTGIKVYSPTSRFPMTMKQIVEGILRYALDCGALEAASSLEERIRLGEERNLIGSQVTLFQGINVEGSHQLPHGMEITSLESVEDQVDLYTIERMLWDRKIVRIGLSSIGVVRWSYKWGPAIAAPDDSELRFTEIPQDLYEIAEVALTALGLVCNAPIDILCSTGENFDRRIARALCYKNRFTTTLEDLKKRLTLFGGNPDQFLSYELSPQVSKTFCNLMQLRSSIGPDQANGSLTAQDLLAMCNHYNDFKLGKSRLTDMAYFVLTMLEKESPNSQSNRRKRAARKYAISRNVLDNVSVLVSNAGGLGQARKAAGGWQGIQFRRSWDSGALGTAHHPKGN